VEATATATATAMMGNKKGDVPDDAVGTLTELFCNIVALVDDKLLVEDLEDLAVGEVGHGCGWRRRRGRGEAEDGVAVGRGFRVGIDGY
jgi:hypothetical protein